MDFAVICRVVRGGTQGVPYGQIGLIPVCNRSGAILSRQEAPELAQCTKHGQVIFFAASAHCPACEQIEDLKFSDV